jgi:hypothetical protein
MSKLYFRAGETEGFTSKKLADKKSGYTNPIRELLQNSLDASKDAGNDKCEINIYIESINKTNIPHIEDYEDTLSVAIEFHKKENSYNHNAEQIVNIIQQELEKDKLKILMFVDKSGLFSFFGILFKILPVAPRAASSSSKPAKIGAPLNKVSITSLFFLYLLAYKT